MNFALWDDIYNNQTTRPVYHAWANLTRNSSSGNSVSKAASTDPSIKASKVGNTIFWINNSYRYKPIRIEGLPLATRVKIMTENTIQGDREAGTTKLLTRTKTFWAPPRSFGYVY